MNSISVLSIRHRLIGSGARRISPIGWVMAAVEYRKRRKTANRYFDCGPSVNSGCSGDALDRTLRPSQLFFLDSSILVAAIVFLPSFSETVPVTSTSFVSVQMALWNFLL